MTSIRELFFNFCYDSSMLKFICTIIFYLSGWKYINRVPSDITSFVFVGAPHTSNHDFLPAMVISRKLKGNVRFIIKDQWLKFPFGIIFKRLGAIGIDRDKIKNGLIKDTTEVIAAFFSIIPQLILMICPEGTRKPTHKWHSGFYHIALKANVPIVLGYADYKKKEAGLGKVIFPKNYEDDMKTIIEFYRDLQGKNPKNFLLPI